MIMSQVQRPTYQELKPFLELVFSQDLRNIELAIQLAKGQGLDLKPILYNLYQLCTGIYHHKPDTYEEFGDREKKQIQSLGAPHQQFISVTSTIFKELPYEISYLRQLKNLYIYVDWSLYKHKPYPYFSRLPTWLAELDYLENLNIAGASLKELPDFVCQLKNLRTLRVMKTPLDKLPKNLGNLSKLESLVLGNNQLKTLPESILDLKYLRHLDLRNNPFDEYWSTTLLKRKLTNRTGRLMRKVLSRVVHKRRQNS